MTEKIDMTDTPKEKEVFMIDETGRKKDKYNKPKPWDNDPNLDKWAVEEFKPEYNKNGMIEESSFSVLFPQYREKYIKEIWPLVKKSLKKFMITAELDAVEGSMTVRTTR